MSDPAAVAAFAAPCTLAQPRRARTAACRARRRLRTHRPPHRAPQLVHTPPSAVVEGAAAVGAPDPGDGDECADEAPVFAVSHFEAAELLSHRGAVGSGDRAALPLRDDATVDLGLTRAPQLYGCARGVWLDDGAHEPLATWAELEKACKRGRTGAFELFADGRAPARVAALSRSSGRALSLQPVAPRAPPTLVVGGFAMHRTRRTDPGLDTGAKLRAARARGSVLDVCTGLGYTAVGAARLGCVRAVTTVEVDGGVVDMQRRNPWSRDLFRDAKIERVVRDAMHFLPSCADASFDCVVHDPPAQALGGELFSAAFYAQLARVAKNGARLFHYIGDPRSKESGRLYAGVRKRLAQAGFERVAVASEAYGVTAVRSAR